jgi:hypothetical protein
MAEPGCIAASRLACSRRIVAGLVRKVTTTVMAMSATRMAQACADDISLPFPHLLLVSMQRLTSSTIDRGVRLVRQWTRFPD